MKIAIYGKQITPESRPYLERLYAILTKAGVELFVNQSFQEFLSNHCNLHSKFNTYSDHLTFQDINANMLLTIGGDGTLLDSATLVRDSGIPILGINTGRLGFLANISKEEVEEAAQNILTEKYSFDERSLIQVRTEDNLNLSPDFALNEVSVSRRGTTSMITVHAWINNTFLNSYWSDGLILATPTGSTGYSLSCGGPIIMPGSENFVITPIAPHNLTVRPFVIPNDVEIRYKVEGREREYLLSLDSRVYNIPNKSEIYLSKAPFYIKLIQTEQQDFASTLRNKLLWGLDKRN